MPFCFGFIRVYLCASVVKKFFAFHYAICG
jgi:hypothetical protein